MDWYYAESGRQIGPIKEEALEVLVRSGVIQPETLVWQQGMPAWQPYRTVRPAAVAVGADSVAPAVAPSDQALRFCSECGRPFPQSELIPFGSSFVCAGCKQTFAQKLREGVNVGLAFRYGGFWIRAVAILIDGAILFTVNMLLNVAGAMLLLRGITQTANPGMVVAYQGVLFLLGLAIGIAYSAFFLVKYAATPGKMALRLKVITARGSPINTPLAIGRYFAHYLSALTLGIGYIMAGFDDQKRALHDRICDTRVIHV
jgi:uncharacterized RDD family membrane protein YckC